MDGNITVQPGDHIPQIPQNIFKAYAEYQPTSKLSIDLDFDAVGRSFARGNENNLDQPDGVYYLGPGFSPGYGVCESGSALSSAEASAVVRADQQPAEPPLLHGGATRINAL